MSRPSEVYVRPLSVEEQEWVHRLDQGTSHVGLKSRCHIILLSAERYSVPQIASLLFRSEDTVARCMHAFNRSGLDQILPQERVGRPAKITEFLKKLLELVESAPRDLGYPFSTWTADLLAVTLKEQTGLEVSESSVRRTLHGQGYSVQRPVLSVSSPDPAYEQKCACLHGLQRRAEAGEIDLYYEDEVDLALLPGIIRCWSKQGQQRKIETPRQNQKQYGAGLIHWATGKLYWARSSRKNNALFRSVLSQGVEPEPGQPPRKKSLVVDH
jgi:transposase